MKSRLVTMTPNEFLKLLKECAFDRPSALNTLCGHLRIRGNVPEIGMHVDDDTPEDRVWMRQKLGRIPKELMEDDWDT